MPGRRNSASQWGDWTRDSDATKAVCMCCCQQGSMTSNYKSGRQGQYPNTLCLFPPRAICGQASVSRQDHCFQLLCFVLDGLLALRPVACRLLLLGWSLGLCMRSPCQRLPTRRSRSASSSGRTKNMDGMPGYRCPLIGAFWTFAEGKVPTPHFKPQTTNPNHQLEGSWIVKIFRAFDGLQTDIAEGALEEAKLCNRV